MTNVHLYPPHHPRFFFLQDIFYVSSRAANGDGDEAAAIKIQTIRMAISAIFSTVDLQKYTTLHGEKTSHHKKMQQKISARSRHHFVSIYSSKS